MKRIVAIFLSLLLMMSLLTACGDQPRLQDGYYTAQAEEFNYGWKEYITILVKGGNIVSVEYNAENASGFIKSWDNAYMQTMLHSDGTYPNEYTRYYANQLSVCLLLKLCRHIKAVGRSDYLLHADNAGKLFLLRQLTCIF